MAVGHYYNEESHNKEVELFQLNTLTWNTIDAYLGGEPGKRTISKTDQKNLKLTDSGSSTPRTLKKLSKTSEKSKKFSKIFEIPSLSLSNLTPADILIFLFL